MSKSTPVPFINKGLVQKKDPAQLAPGEFYQLENAWSQQEGALTARTGHQKLTSVALLKSIVSISKLNLGGADTSNPRYMGSGEFIYRDLPNYSSNTVVYSGLSSDARWSAQQYNAGTSGSPALFFATDTVSLRDNGSYTTLQKWGVDPPPVPVQATINIPSIQYVTGFTTAPRFVPSVNSDSGGNKTVSAINTVNGAGNPGYTQIVPTAGGTINGVNGIYVGMILEIFDSSSSSLDELIVVLAVDSVSFYAVTQNAHVAGNVTLAWYQEPQTITATSQTYVYGSLTIDAAFNGTPDNGYETDDNFHIALLCSDVTNITKIEIRVVPNWAGSPGASTDYYSFDVVPASLMSVGSVNSPAWLEINIPKNTFTKVGNAGSGVFTWLNVNEIDVVVTSNAIAVTEAATFSSSSVYFIGGGGLNSTAAGTSLYDWLYTFRNPTTGQESNPCPAMIPANIPPGITNGKMSLTLTGTLLAATQANGIYEISGPGSMNIYRRGGTFSDGFYRHVGYAANPGSGGKVIFVDNASDESLDTATTLQFDNDPPVPSSLPVPLTGTISSFQPSGGGTDYQSSSLANGQPAGSFTTNAITRMILESLPTNFPFPQITTLIAPGSTIIIGFGNTGETCIVSSIGYSNSGSDVGVVWVEAFLQYNHYQSLVPTDTYYDSSDTVECDTNIRGACDIIHQDFDCLFLAGDKNNPATLYQSKVGRPEAFPVVNLENNFAQQINVGSPSNPIYGVTSIGPGEIVSLNLNNIFIIQVWAGQMQAPIQAPASRGLFAKFCWCKGDNRIWYLAYDGIYVWGGGESKKVSENIDYLFKKQTVNGIPPINMSQADLFTFAYAENCLFIGYVDIDNIYHRLRYETLYNRWTIDTIVDSHGSVYAFTGLFTEPDTGDLLIGVTNSSLLSYLWLCDFYSTTDGWTSAPNDGVPIKYNAWQYWPIADPSADYQVGEVLLEIVNPNDTIDANLFFNYSTTPTNTLVVAGGAVPVRGRYFATVNDAESGTVQYSIGLQVSGTTGEAGLTAFYTFQWRDFPWSDSGYPGPKTFGWLNIQANTKGASVPMQLQIDGQSVFSFNITGTFWNRSNIITLPSNLTGVQWRVVPVSGAVGTIQIYSVEPKFEKLPMPLTHWDSLMQIYGSSGWKYIWQVWIDYQSAVSVVFSIYRDGNVLFYQVTLPAHSQRAVERFYLPPAYTPAGGTSPQFNKSQSYQCLLDASDGLTPFQMYRDGSRLETLNLDGEQRADFEQHIIWTLEPVQA